MSLYQANPSASFCLVDDANPNEFKIGESLPFSGTKVLERIDPTMTVVNSLQASDPVIHHPCSANASAWGTTELTTFTTTKEEELAAGSKGVTGGGWHLNRAKFDQTLREALKKNAGENVVRKGRVTTVSKVDEESGAWYWKVMVDARDSSEPVELRAKWIIDATGRSAYVATKIGAKVIWPDALLAFYTTFQSSTLSSPSPHPDTDHRTIVETTPNGWFYTSLVPTPVSKHGDNDDDPSADEYIQTRTVCYHTLSTHPTAKTARRRDGSGLLELIYGDEGDELPSTLHLAELLKQHGYELPPTLPGAAKGVVVASTTAGSSHLSPQCDTRSAIPEGEGLVGGRWIAVGDAAMAFDPLSSQGMMTALEMGLVVGMLIGKKLVPSTADAGSPAALGMDAEVQEKTRVAFAKPGATGLEQVYARARAVYETKVKRSYEAGKEAYPGESFWEGKRSVASHS
ncbi:hypothetical protein DL93DRAFT_2091065 [Clavulina sp. PMI_390]|nr:hypothetical protein DL93DRAFT_2091065 [Clavulina sp. PMI_390]